MDPTEKTETEYTPLAKLGGLPLRRKVKTPAPEPPPAAAPPLFTPVASLVAVQPGATFLCPNCRASLLAPVGEFTGLCPACGHLIAEASTAPLPLVPLPSPAGGQTPLVLPVPGADPLAAVPPLATAGPAGEPEGQDADLVPRRPDTHRLTRTGNFSFRTLALEDVPDRQPEFDQEPPGPEQPKATPIPYVGVRRPRFTAKWLLTAAAVIMLLSLFALIGTSWFMRGHKQPLIAPSGVPVEELRKGLEASAVESLNAILGSNDPAVIAGHLIGGEKLIPAIQERLDADDPFPRISEAAVVSPTSMNESDFRSGFCGLLYQAAPGDPMRLDSPLLSAAMAKGVTGMGLLEAGAVIENQSAPAPRQALALFAKRNGQLLLEWDLFIQTWDRTLIAFSDGELGNGPMRFRVVLSLDKPVFENGEFVDQTVIRVQDPLHQQDILRVVTYPQDPVVTALMPTARELIGDPLAAMKPRTATVDLIRSENGRVAFERLVCREFLGLGGQENASGTISSEIGNR